MSEKLTPEQEDLMLAYDNKWWEIMYATEPMDNKKAADAIKEAYLVIGEKEPEIIFCHSPYEAVNLVLRGKSITQLYEEFGVNLVDQFTEKLYCKTLGSIMAQTSN